MTMIVTFKKIFCTTRSGQDGETPRVGGTEWGDETCFGPGMHAPKARAVQLSHVASMRAENRHLFELINLQSSLTSLDYLGPQDRRRRFPHGYGCFCDAPLRVPGPQSGQSIRPSTTRPISTPPFLGVGAQCGRWTSSRHGQKWYSFEDFFPGFFHDDDFGTWKRPGSFFFLPFSTSDCEDFAHLKLAWPVLKFCFFPEVERRIATWISKMSFLAFNVAVLGPWLKKSMAVWHGKGPVRVMTPPRVLLIRGNKRSQWKGEGVACRDGKLKFFCQRFAWFVLRFPLLGPALAAGSRHMIALWCLEDVHAGCIRNFIQNFVWVPSTCRSCASRFNKPSRCETDSGATSIWDGLSQMLTFIWASM